MWAAEAYFKYGGEPRFIFPTTLGPWNQSLPPSSAPSPSSSHPPTTPSWASQPTASPVTVSSPTSGGGLGRPVIGPEVMLSGKHEGFCVYLSRLLRPLWHMLIADEVQIQGFDQPSKVGRVKLHVHVSLWVIPP